MAQLAFIPRTRPALGARMLSRRRPFDRRTSTTDQAPVVRSADPRTTIAHVQVLEAALEEQARLVAELTEQLALERARPHEPVRRVAATVEGLRVAFGKDPVAERLLARIDAALDRLVAPGELLRVPLPEPTTTQPTAEGSTRTAAHALVVQSGAGSTSPQPTAAAADGTPELDRVLPVPVEPETRTEPRRRRGIRR